MPRMKKKRVMIDLKFNLKVGGSDSRIASDGMGVTISTLSGEDIALVVII